MRFKIILYVTAICMWMVNLYGYNEFSDSSIGIFSDIADLKIQAQLCCEAQLYEESANHLSLIIEDPNATTQDITYGLFKRAECYLQLANFASFLSDFEEIKNIFEDSQLSQHRNSDHLSWICKFCGNCNEYWKEYCSKCGRHRNDERNDPDKRVDWICKNCRTKNKYYAESCKSCGEPKK